MDSFLFCLILVALIAAGGREQMMMAQLSDRLSADLADGLAQGGGAAVRRPVPLLVIGCGCAAVSAGAMTWAGISLAAIMPARAAWMMVALALAIAAFELAWPVRPKPLREPTRSLFAIGLVLLWRQLGDAARFVIFAFALEATYPITAFVGGALGGVVAVAAGWMLGADTLSRWPLRAVRLALGLALIVAAIFIGLNARYSYL